MNTRNWWVLKHYKYTVFFISWMAFILLVSLFSFSGLDGPGINFPHRDKVAHIILYFIAAIAGCFCIRERSRGTVSIGAAIGLMVISLMIYGMIIEVIQLEFTTWRSGEMADALANGLGALLGTGTIKILFSMNRRLKWKN